MRSTSRFPVHRTPIPAQNNLHSKISEVHCFEQQCRSATELLSLPLSWRRAVSISIAWLTSPRRASRASCQGTDHMWEIKLIRLAYPFMTEQKHGHVPYFVNIQPGSYPENGSQRLKDIMKDEKDLIERPTCFPPYYGSNDWQWRERGPSPTAIDDRYRI